MPHHEQEACLPVSIHVAIVAPVCWWCFESHPRICQGQQRAVHPGNKRLVCLLTAECWPIRVVPEQLHSPAEGCTALHRPQHTNSSVWCVQYLQMLPVGRVTYLSNGLKHLYAKQFRA